MKFYALRFYDRDEILFRREICSADLDLLRGYSLESGTDLVYKQSAEAVNLKFKARGAKFKTKRAALGCKIRSCAKYLLRAGKFCGASCGATS
ncbi:hypothetical protein [uncultured Campylobacter sp.]|uniref:hypothetical protein n=1 Tax=uncultured Campylobacter sp. TaxID=218934 RepID=UPI0026169690|nr:hypothetical protein [uncultured Campylobacter sp.]